MCIPSHCTMNRINNNINGNLRKNSLKGLVCVCLISLIFPFNIFSADQRKPINIQKRNNAIITNSDSVISINRNQFHNPRQPFAPVLSDTTIQQKRERESIVLDSIANDSVAISPKALLADSLSNNFMNERKILFNPNPTKAVWLSALFPGLGQIYNRRYWKLPIIVGGYMGLAYATSWNNRMLSDYTNAYRDIMDTDPTTKSYMDFFPPTVKEENLDKTWLTNTLKSRKNYFRQNRDLCIICMVGVYLLAMVDAYVDASLSQFDITPDISMQVSPTIMQESRDKLPSIGMHWALCF